MAAVVPQVEYAELEALLEQQHQELVGRFEEPLGRDDSSQADAG